MAKKTLDKEMAEHLFRDFGRLKIKGIGSLNKYLYNALGLEDAYQEIKIKPESSPLYVIVEHSEQELTKIEHIKYSAGFSPFGVKNVTYVTINGEELAKHGLLKNGNKPSKPSEPYDFFIIKKKFNGHRE
jgi:hypothetical protein